MVSICCFCKQSDDYTALMWAACFEDSSFWEARSTLRTRLSFLQTGTHPCGKAHGLTVLLHHHNNCPLLPCRLQMLLFKPSKTCKFLIHATVPLYKEKLLKDSKTHLVHPFPTLEKHFVLLQSPQTPPKLY